MKGDFTRDTFDPLKNFSRVLMQQGRVQLDADWNEQNAILLHYLRTLAADLLGPHAGPAVGRGFDLITGETVKRWGDDGLDPAEQWAKIEPDEARQKVLSEAVEKHNNAVIGVGRYYVHGVLVENHRPILYTEQLGYPFSPEMQLENLQNKELIVYLDVWERHITWVQDDHIREVALGGADTCTRAQVVWQVKALLRGDQNTFDCGSVETLLARLNPPTLRARARRETPSPELCSVSPESKYRGLENHLYRVEVHELDVGVKGGGKGKKAGTTATFKWSRDNGSRVYPLVSLSETRAVVATLGRDQCTQLKPGDWVEVCDDLLALRGQSGPLARVERVDRDELTVTLKWPDGVTELPGYAQGDATDLHPLLRRWDHAGDPAAWHGALPVSESADRTEGWIALEDGVEVWFAEGGEYRVGDYWLIPARVATGDVEWPRTRDSAGAEIANDPALLPPHGPQHYYAPLLAVTSDAGGNTKSTECRCLIHEIVACP
jgi:hypothetical protein